MKKDELKELVLTKPLPNNIGIILDGNGRWAKKRGLPRIAGHAKGIKTLVEIAEVAQDLGLKNVLVYAFSTENWSRPEPEVSFLMKALIDSLNKYKARIIKRKTRIKIIGERTNLTPKILEAIENIEESTKEFNNFTLYICFNYGSRQEIVHGVKDLCQRVVNQELKIEDITPELFDQALYTKEVGPIDLLIRTSGEERLSNFLLWQLAYSEFVFTKTYWPDFHEKEFLEAIYEYQSRSRRFGGVKEENVK